MTSALASMDLCEQVAALFPGDAPHEDAIGATAVEIPFYHCVSLSHSHYALSRYLVFRKEVVFQVVPDLGDPCIIGCGSPRSSGPSRVHTTLGRLHGWSTAGTASFEVLVRPPSPSPAGWAEGFSSRLWKTPYGTGA
jgi:hypothetical protein